MIEIVVKGDDLWDENEERFVSVKPVILHMEHSLISLSKWEAKFKKSFLKTREKTLEETLYYYKCMTITKNVKDEVYTRLSSENIQEINNYISDPMTATHVPDVRAAKGATDTQTAEVIYYQMLSNGIPIEFEKWHLNRLITLIRVFNHKNNPNGSKMSNAEIFKRNRDLNQLRRAQANSKG